MEEKITLSISQLRNIFISGSEFGEQTYANNIGELEEITALDFGELMMKEFNIVLD